MTRKGVWNIQQVRDKYLQDLWEYKVNLFSWGYNADGVLGHNQPTSTKYSSPVQIGSSSNWKASGAGNNETRNIATKGSAYGIKNDGTLWSWGNNHKGQLGVNDKTSRSSPIQIPGTTYSSVSGGYYNNAAVKTDGTLWSWGYNYLGLLGQNEGTPAQYSSPVQVPGTNWSSSASGHYIMLARKTDGTLWSWGHNGNGQLGLNAPQNANQSSPVQIPGTDWSEQYCSNQSACSAIKTDGTLWMWGRNHWGQLGQNSPVNSHRSSPVQVGSGSNWAILARGTADKTSNPIAIKTDGTLWTWGLNDYGQLGQNSEVQVSSPVQVGTDATWSTTMRPSAINYGRTIWVLKSDNTLWAWGSNTYGQLGVNDRTTYSSPVQVAGTTWNEVFSHSDGGAFGVKANLTPSQL